MAGNCDLADLLRFELQFIQDGGYGRAPRFPWLQPTALLDSPTCLNFGDPARTLPCTDCLLIQFVPPERRSEVIPCHHIPLDNKGETLDSLYHCGSQREIEEKLANWLRRTIVSLQQGSGSGEHEHESCTLTYPSIKA